jgi:hypothetical protein
LTGYALAGKVTHLGEEFPKPEHGGDPPWFESLGRDRYPVYCGAFTV